MFRHSTLTGIRSTSDLRLALSESLAPFFWNLTANRTDSAPLSENLLGQSLNWDLAWVHHIEHLSQQSRPAASFLPPSTPTFQVC